MGVCWGWTMHAGHGPSIHAQVPRSIDRSTKRPTNWSIAGLGWDGMDWIGLGLDPKAARPNVPPHSTPSAQEEIATRSISSAGGGREGNPTAGPCSSPWRLPALPLAGAPKAWRQLEYGRLSAQILSNHRAGSDCAATALRPNARRLASFAALACCCSSSSFVPPRGFCAFVRLSCRWMGPWGRSVPPTTPFDQSIDEVHCAGVGSD